MRRQGLQFSRVSQAAGNLKFNPTRFQAQQPLEQTLTLRREAMLCINVAELVNAVLRCLLKGHELQLVSAGLTSLRRYIQIYYKIIAFPPTVRLGNVAAGKSACCNFVPAWRRLASFPRPRRLNPRQVTPPPPSAWPGLTGCESQRRQGGGVCRWRRETGRLGCFPPIQC